MKNLNFLIALPFMFLSTLSNGYCTHSTSTLRCVKYVDNYDADTITVDIHDLHPIIGKNMKIRVAGIDAPEIRGKPLCEKELAIKSRNEIRKILINAETINLTSIERGKYFRIAATVIADGLNIGEYLLKRKLAYKYDGGTKEEIDWCAVMRLYH